MMMKKEKTAGKAKTVGTLFTGDDLKKLIFPLIIEQILAVSVGMVDTMMVSSAGEAATSGVSLVDIIIPVYGTAILIQAQILAKILSSMPLLKESGSISSAGFTLGTLIV